MTRELAAGLLGLLAAGGASAQTLPSSAMFATGRELLVAGQSLEAADAFHHALRDEAPGGFTLRVAVYCDLANLDGHLRRSGNPPELFVLRRSVGGRPCLALYWGLFPSRAAASAARGAVPAALRTAGQSPAAVFEILPPGEPPPVQAASALGPPVAAPAEVVEREPAPPEPVPAAEPFTPPAPVEPYRPVSPPVASEPAPLAPEPAESGRVPVMEISGAYSGLWDDLFAQDDGDGVFELGWKFSACANLTPSLGVVGDASAHFESSQELPALGLTLERAVLGVHGGLRYTHRGGGFAVPYVQALAGWTRTSFELGEVRTVEDDFSVQPGLGLQLRLSRSVGLDLGADYRLVLSDLESRSEVRLHAGLVVAIGSR